MGWRRWRGGRAFINARPNPLPGWNGLGRTTLTWDTGDGSPGLVKLVTFLDGRYVEVPVSEQPRGSVVIHWIQPAYAYRFRLYRVSGAEQLQAETIVAIAERRVQLAAETAALTACLLTPLVVVAVVLRTVGQSLRRPADAFLYRLR